MPGEPWMSEEPRFRDVARRVLSRARRRPRRVVAIALLATTAAVAYRGLKVPTYEATLYFRLEEGALGDPRGAPRPPADIRQYVTSVALSRQQVETIMRKHRISTAWLAADRVGAIDDFRSEIAIEVSRNYFLYQRTGDDPPRSAQVAVSVLGTDPEVTVAIVHEIGDAILRDQAARWSGGIASARAFIEAQADQARARTKSVQATIDRLTRDASAAAPDEAIGIRAHVARLEAELRGVIDQTAALEARAANVALASGGGEEQLGLRFELFDEALASYGERLTPSALASRGALVLACALLLAACAVGAFDDRIYVPQDLAAHGLPVLAALPRFPPTPPGASARSTRS